MAQNTTHRYTKAVRIKPEMISEYKRLHTDVWPEVTNALLQVGISNYSLFVIGDLAVEYLEYSGDDFEENLAIMENNPAIKRWEAICDKCCLLPITDNPDSGGFWSSMEEIFHLD